MALDIDSIPFPWIRRELQLPSERRRGNHGRSVERIQEWLTLNSTAVVVDGDFGPATEYAVGRFQARRGLPKTGVVDDATFLELTLPLHRALSSPETTLSSLSAGVVAAARGHHRERPREVGGPNRGPWVRVYMEGVEGPSSLWCAGFASLMVRQAAWHAGVTEPFPHTVSCDVLAAEASADGRFVTESDVARGITPLDDLPRGSLYVLRTGNDDWTHVGVVVTAGSEIIETIEGNTNEGGSLEGYEVCRRIRNLRNKDFITLQPLNG